MIEGYIPTGKHNTIIEYAQANEKHDRLFLSDKHRKKRSGMLYMHNAMYKEHYRLGDVSLYSDRSIHTAK